MPDKDGRTAASPCLECGACCAIFRCSFYWGECDDATPGGVPVKLTEDMKPFRRVMKGTRQKKPRCIALQGEVGVGTRCGIYARRPSTCRLFEPSYQNGASSERCDRARAAYGLAPLTPDDWNIMPLHPDKPTRPRRVA